MNLFVMWFINNSFVIDYSITVGVNNNISI